jgi:Schlafen, AlbA_2
MPGRDAACGSLCLGYGSDMAEPVPPDVTEDQLKLLLDQQSETEILDYKSELDLVDRAKKPRAQVGLAKDIAALLSGRGGHLVIGADESGTPTGKLNAEQAAQLDESRLRKRLEKFIPEGFQIRVASHEIGGTLIALIHVSPHSDGLVVMKADGAYLEGKKERIVFRAGDIFIRRGTESRRLGQAELRRHLADLRRRVEEEARAEALRSVAPVIEQSQQAEVISAGAADRLSWDLDRHTLVSVVTEQLRRGDEVPLRLLIESAPAQAGRILRPDPDDKPEDLDSNQDAARAEFGALLDKIAALAARGLVLQNDTLLQLAIEALRSIYDGAADQYGRERRDLMLEPAEVWLLLIERVYALGALAVRSDAGGQSPSWHCSNRTFSAKAATAAGCAMPTGWRVGCENPNSSRELVSIRFPAAAHVNAIGVGSNLASVPNEPSTGASPFGDASLGQCRRQTPVGPWRCQGRLKIHPLAPVEYSPTPA